MPLLLRGWSTERMGKSTLARKQPYRLHRSPVMRAWLCDRLSPTGTEITGHSLESKQRDVSAGEVWYRHENMNID